MKYGTTAFLLSALLALPIQNGDAQVGPGIKVSLPTYVVRCTDVTMPRAIDESHYKANLASGVALIDKSLASNSATGTPFIEKSENRHTVVAAATANSPEVSEEQLVVTICAVVDSSSGNPSDPQIHQEIHSNETVFAMKCKLTDADTCIEKLRTALVTLLNSKLQSSSLVPTVPSLFWRSASTSLDDVPDSSLGSVLVENDARKVTVAPDVTTSGAQADFDLVASLTKPIDQQVQRPLLHKGPTSYSVTPRPGDKWIVTAITLSPQITAALP